MKLAIVDGVGAGISAARQARRFGPAAAALALLVAAPQLAKALD
jgi:hypothetical protein